MLILGLGRRMDGAYGGPVGELVDVASILKGARDFSKANVARKAGGAVDEGPAPGRTACAAQSAPARVARRVRVR